MGRFFCDDIFGASEFSIELDVEFNATNSIKAVAGINLPKDLAVYYLNSLLANTNDTNTMDTSTGLMGVRRVILRRGKGAPSNSPVLKLVSLIEINSTAVDNCAYLIFAGGDWDGPTLPSLGMNPNDTFLLIGPDINTEYMVENVAAEYLGDNQITNLDGSRPTDSLVRDPRFAPLRAIVTSYDKYSAYRFVPSLSSIGYHNEISLRTWDNEIIINNKVFTKEEVNVGDILSLKRSTESTWSNYLVTYFSPDEGNNMTGLAVRSYDNSALVTLPRLTMPETYVMSVLKREYRVEKVVPRAFSYDSKLTVASIYSPREGIWNPNDGIEYPGLLPSEIQLQTNTASKLYNFGLAIGDTFMFTGTKYRGPYIYEFIGSEDTSYVDQEFIRNIDGTDIVGHIAGADEDLSDPTSTSHDKLVAIVKDGNPNATYVLSFIEGNILTSGEGETGVSDGNQLYIFGVINDNIKSGDVIEFTHINDGYKKLRISSYSYWAGIGTFYLEGLNGEDISLTTVHAADISLCPKMSYTIKSCTFTVEEHLI